MYTLKTNKYPIPLFAVIFEYALIMYVGFAILITIGIILIDSFIPGVVLGIMAAIIAINYLSKHKHTQQITIDPEHITITYTKLLRKHTLVLDTKYCISQQFSWVAVPKARGVAMAYHMIQIRNGPDVLYETELNPKLDALDCDIFINYHKRLREYAYKLLIYKDAYLPIDLADKYAVQFKIL